MINKDTLDRARELGISLIESREYKELQSADNKFSNDDEAKELIRLLNAKKELYNEVKLKEIYDSSIIKTIIEDMEELELKVKCNKTIENLNKCQNNYNKLMRNVNNVIDYYTGNDKIEKGCHVCGKGCCNK